MSASCRGPGVISITHSLGWLGPWSREEGWTKSKAHPEPTDPAKTRLAMRCLSDGVHSICHAVTGRVAVPGRERTPDGLTRPVLSSRIKRNTSGDELVRCAVDAATAYESILSAIRAAEDAASKATSASESAFQVGTGSYTSSLLDCLGRQLICLLSHA